MIKLSVQAMQKIAETNPQAKQLLQQWEALEQRIEADFNNKLQQKLQVVSALVPALSKDIRDLEAWERLRDVCDEAIEIIDPTPEDIEVE